MWETKACAHTLTHRTQPRSAICWLCKADCCKSKLLIRSRGHCSAPWRPPVSPSSPSHLTNISTEALPVWNVFLHAQLWEAMFGCHFIDPWLTGARVKICNNGFFPLPCTQHWLVSLSSGWGLPVVACRPGIGSVGRVIEYWSLPGPADTEVMWILWLSTA